MVQCRSSICAADALLGCTGPMGSCTSTLLLRDALLCTAEPLGDSDVVGGVLGGVTRLGETRENEELLLGDILGGVILVGEFLLKCIERVGESLVGVQRAGDDLWDPPPLGE